MLYFFTVKVSSNLILCYFHCKIYGEALSSVVNLHKNRSRLFLRKIIDTQCNGKSWILYYSYLTYFWPY